ncbi:MAG TPA: hypothetical protein VLQ89_08885, partial [Candidatus Binatia bacterium]|nr:hypothetical protein [Candidatus Binatia bacterium]
TSRQMTGTVARILEESPAAPVIMILSDHGYRGSRGRVKNGRQVPAAERFKVFNALYLPGLAADAIDPALAPRDNFRLVFSHCFAAPLSIKKNH